VAKSQGRVEGRRFMVIDFGMGGRQGRRVNAFRVPLQ